VFHVSDKAILADIESRDIKYLYSNKGEYWFCDPDNPRDRFSLTESVVLGQIQYIKENALVRALTFNEDIIGLKMPIKVDLKVAEAPPAVKGNTATGANKQVTLETGAVVTTPIFINEGDIIRVNTETGEYTERVEKQ